MAKVKAKRITPMKEVPYRPTVFIDNKQSKGVKNLKIGQRVNLSGIVVAHTDRKNYGQKATTEVNIEIKNIGRKTRKKK